MGTYTGTGQPGKGEPQYTALLKINEALQEQLTKAKEETAFAETHATNLQDTLAQFQADAPKGLGAAYASLAVSEKTRHQLEAKLKTAEQQSMAAVAGSQHYQGLVDEAKVDLEEAIQLVSGLKAVSKTNTKKLQTLTALKQDIESQLKTAEDKLAPVQVALDMALLSLEDAKIDLAAEQKENLKLNLINLKLSNEAEAVPKADDFPLPVLTPPEEQNEDMLPSVAAESMYSIGPAVPNHIVDTLKVFMDKAEAKNILKGDGDVYETFQDKTIAAVEGSTDTVAPVTKAEKRLQQARRVLARISTLCDSARGHTEYASTSIPTVEELLTSRAKGAEGAVGALLADYVGVHQNLKAYSGVLRWYADPKNFPSNSTTTVPELMAKSVSVLAMYEPEFEVVDEPQQEFMGAASGTSISINGKELKGYGKMMVPPGGEPNLHQLIQVMMSQLKETVPPNHPAVSYEASIALAALMDDTQPGDHYLSVKGGIEFSVDKDIAKQQWVLHLSEPPLLSFKAHFSKSGELMHIDAMGSQYAWSGMG